MKLIKTYIHQRKTEDAAYKVRTNVAVFTFT